MSTFARRPNAIADSEEAIDKLMADRTSLDDYISKSKKPMSVLIEAMKTEMFWDLIASDFRKYDVEEPVAETKKESGKREDGPLPKTESKQEPVKTETKVEEPKKEDDMDLSEEDLLKELENF